MSQITTDIMKTGHTIQRTSTPSGVAAWIIRDKEMHVLARFYNERDTELYYRALKAAANI
jgi:hypothetical protein